MAAMTGDRPHPLEVVDAGLQGAPGVELITLASGSSGTVTFENVADFGEDILQTAIAISGAGWREELCGCCDAFISKPVDGEHLIDTLRGLELGHFVKHSRGSLRW